MLSGAGLTPAAAAAHARQVGELWEAYGQGRNQRVPITFVADEQVWLKVAGETFGRFYADPRVHLRAQLEGRRWFGEHVVGDMAPAPSQWDVGVQLWMAEDEYFGCRTRYQEDDYAWSAPLPLDRDDLLRHLADLDAEERVRQGRDWRLYCDLRELTADLTFEGRPVRVHQPGTSTHGVFTKAAEIRGPEQLCLDLYEAPDFAHRFLELVTDRILDRIRVWHRLVAGRDPDWPDAAGFHLCDDSLQLLSPELYRRFVLPCHERLYRTVTTGPRRLHLCGLATQHFEILGRELGVVSIDGPGPFADHGRYLRDLGPRFAFPAQLDHAILERGTPAQIDTMMRDLLTPGARQPGRFQVAGFLTRHTPLENVRLCYEAGRRYGAIHLDTPT
ncbi:MAG: uroporphyrinogen decarboxylase family protein [Gemmatimonadota bacterium]